MPSEKYSPLLLVLSLYVWPDSLPVPPTSACAIGFPSESLQVPFTVPVVCANASGTDNPARTSSRGRMKYFLMICLPALHLNLLNSTHWFRIRASLQQCRKLSEISCPFRG